MSTSTSPQIPLDDFDASIKSRYIEISSAALGGLVLSCSDDFFASKDNLIKPSASASLKGQFGPNGALYDGWESRRHNLAFDWAIVLLAPPRASVAYVDIDTSHFSGNEAPASEVFGIQLTDEEREAYAAVARGAKGRKLGADDKRWTRILEHVTLGPNSRHIFKIQETGQTYSALMVRMIPDGGMARFRAYGHPLSLAIPATLPPPGTAPLNLLSPLVGAHIVACSDANFSPPQNLLLPGRGHDMSDGWETRRSQVGRGKYGPGGALEGRERKEWVVGRLGATGVVRFVEVDSAYHVGNYPVVEATLSDAEVPLDDAEWTVIVRTQPLGPHRQHWFDVERAVSPSAVFSHVRCSIYPDGGLKRLRIFGFPLAASATAPVPAGPLRVPALPLTYEAFAPYGHVVQGYDLPTSAPKGIVVNVANQGTAFKFHRLAAVVDGHGAAGNGVRIGSVRQAPVADVRAGALIEVKALERHMKYSQAFIPQGKGGSGITPGGAYLVVVALNGADDRPDLSTLRAFLATEAQGVSYAPGVWHHRLLTLNETVDYAFVDAQSGDFARDTEILTPASPYAIVDVEPYTVPSALVRSASAPSVHSTLTAPLSALSGTITPVPITHAAFAPFGALIRTYPAGGAPSSAPTASIPAASVVVKHEALADVSSTYPADAGAITGIAVFRATPKVGLARGRTFDVRLMERHRYTTQAFIPMGKAEWTGKGEPALPGTGSFLVIVAQNGADDRPDPKTLSAFIMEAGTGLSYAPGVWHHPVLVLDATLDLACVETQVSTGVPEPDERDCELLEWDGDDVFGRVAVPAL